MHMDSDEYAPQHGASHARGFSDAAGRPGPLTRTDYREELDLSGRSLSYTAGLASTCMSFVVSVQVFVYLYPPDRHRVTS